MLNRDFLIVAATFMEIESLIKCSTLLSDSFSSSGVRIITGKFNRDRYNNDDYNDNDNNDNNDKRDSIHYRTRAEDDKNFTIIVTGAGVINTAHGLTVYLENHINDHKNLIIIQTGIAGVFKSSGLKIGDIAVAESDTYIHTGVGLNLENASCCYPLNPLPFELVHNCTESNNGKFIFDKELVKRVCININNSLNIINNSLIKKINRQVEEKNCNVLLGGFITVSTITATHKQADHLFKAFNRPCMESMEGAASAHIASLYNIPFIEIRAGSNFVGERDKDKWNIPLACNRACFAVKSIIENGGLFVESRDYSSRQPQPE